MICTPIIQSQVGARVVGFGTCRLSAALRSNRDHFGYKVRFPEALGFAHTSAELIQQIRWLRNEIDIPPDVWAYISGRPFRQSPSKGIEADAVVVEISSIQPVVFDGFVLQINRLGERFKDVPNLWRVWRKHAKATQLEERLRRLAACPEMRSLDLRRAEILQRAEMRTASVESMRQDLLHMRAMLAAPLLVVTPCDAGPGHTISMVTRRKTIRSVVDACAEAGIPVHDPSLDLAAIGPEAAFEQRGLDTQHYTSAFAARVGTSIGELLWPNHNLAEDAAASRDVVLARQLRGADPAKQPAAVLSTANELLSIEGRSRLAWSMKARSESVLGRHDVALSSWAQALRTDGCEPALQFEAAQAAFSADQNGRALAFVVETLVSGEAEDTVPNLGIARILFANGHVERASAHLRRHLSSDASALDDLVRSSPLCAFSALACRAAIDEHGPDAIGPILRDLAARALKAARAAGEAEDFAGQAAALGFATTIAKGCAGLHRRIMAEVKAIVVATVLASRSGPPGAFRLRLESLAGLHELTPALHLLLGTALAVAGNHELAARHIAIALARGDADERRRAGKALRSHAMRAEDWNAAMAYFKVLAGQMPTLDAGVLEISAGLLRRAALEFRAAQDGADNGLDALEAARRLLRFDPAHPQARLFVIFSSDPSVDRAERQWLLVQALRATPDLVARLLRGTRDAYKAGDLARSTDYCLAAFSATPDEEIRQQLDVWRARLVRSHVVRLRVLQAAGSDKVEATAHLILDLDPRHRTAQWALARVYLNERRWNEARQSLERLAAVDQDVGRANQTLRRRAG